MRNKIMIITFVLMLAVFVVLQALPHDAESIKAENRTMSTIPPVSKESILAGEFEQGFEDFLGDNVAYRSSFTEWSKIMEEKRGFVPETGKIISTNKDIGTGTTQKQTLLSADNAIMEMFIRNPQSEEKYAEAINHYADGLSEEIRIFNMIIPTQLEFKEPIYKNLQDSQATAIKDIYEKLDDRVEVVDACEMLGKHFDEYIYFRTDHHWTQLGAYYGYRAFMACEGGNAVDKKDYDTGKIKDFLGYLYDRVSRDNAVEPDTIEWYDINYDDHISTRMFSTNENGEFYEYNGVIYDRSKTNYNFFFGSDHPIVEMTNERNTDGKTIVVMKDSYTNVLAPWLAESYKTVILIDPRIYKGTFDDIIDRYSVDEVLFVNYIFTTNFGDYCDLMKNLY